jgi:drug/metabolite transporter (DMT)-like permease
VGLLARTDASAASLMLALEGAATALIAWFIFHEGFDRRIFIGFVCLVAGAIILSWSGTPSGRQWRVHWRSWVPASSGVSTTT